MNHHIKNTSPDPISRNISLSLTMRTLSLRAATISTFRVSYNSVARVGMTWILEIPTAFGVIFPDGETVRLSPST